MTRKEAPPTSRHIENVVIPKNNQKMKNKNIVIIRDTPLTIQKQQVKERIYSKKDGKYTYTKARIESIVNKIKKADYNYIVAVNVPQIGWRSSKQFSGTEPIEIETHNVYSGWDWEDTDQFILYYWKKPPLRGGDDNENNDCLFKCICEAIKFDNIPMQIRGFRKFKHFLGLERNDKVPVDKLELIEKTLKVKINCFGDYEYLSKIKSNWVINLQLSKEHYSLVKNYNSSLINGFPIQKDKKDQKLAIYKSYDNYIEVFNGDETLNYEKEEFYKLKNDLYGEYAYVEYSYDKKTGEPKPTLQDFYNTFLSNVELLHKKSIEHHCEINMKKTGYNIKKTALWLFFNYSHCFKEPEEIPIEEEQCLNNAFMGALINCESGKEIEYAFDYDLNAQYPNAMSSTYLSFPMCKGKFQTLDNDLPEILEYGIYRAEVLKSGDDNIDKLFRFNFKNYYTHIDLNHARDNLKLQINLNHDGGYNFLSYKEGRMNASKIFGTLIDKLIELQQDGTPFIKQLRNIIWGSLCEKKKCTQIASLDKKKNIDDCIVKHIVPFGDGKVKVDYIKTDRQQYKHNYARIGVFLTAFTRKQLGEVIYPIRDHVYQFHTDGFVSDIVHKYLKISEKMGDWKMKHQGPCIIHNKTKVEWVNTT